MYACGTLYLQIIYNQNSARRENFLVAYRFPFQDFVCLSFNSLVLEILSSLPRLDYFLILVFFVIFPWKCKNSQIAFSIAIVQQASNLFHSPHFILALFLSLTKHGGSLTRKMMEVCERECDHQLCP